MKTLRLLSAIILMFLAIPSFTQENGFFHIYSNHDGIRFHNFCPIETDDGCYIVTANNGLNGVCTKLLKLSHDGIVIDSMDVDVPNEEAFYIKGIYRHPNEPGSFIGLGLHYYYDTITAENITINRYSIPYLIQFDDQLNISMRKLVDLPEAFRQKALNYSYLLYNDGEWRFFVELRYFTPRPLSEYHRFYGKMSLDGDLFNIVERTDSIDRSGSVLFKFPLSNDIGASRYDKSVLHPGLTKFHKLYRIDEKMQLRELNELRQFGEDTLDYSVTISTRFNTLCYTSAKILPLDDSTLLFSMKADEFWYQCVPDEYGHFQNIFTTDPAAVLFKTDLECNMKDFHVFKSFNDSIEVVPSHSVDLVEDNTGDRKNIYHCCYSQYEDLYELPNTLTLTKLTDEFDVLWQKSFIVPDIYLEAHHLITTTDGGCLVVGSATRGAELQGGALYNGERNNWFVLKVNSDGLVGTDEIIVKDLRPYSLYPNPTQGELRLQYSPDAEPSQIELHDLQGRLVHSQRGSLQSLNISQLPAGIYTMRVTMKDGTTFVDKVVKE